jgi:hypothetical protein
MTSLPDEIEKACARLVQRVYPLPQLGEHGRAEFGDIITSLARALLAHVERRLTETREVIASAEHEREMAVRAHVERTCVQRHYYNQAATGYACPWCAIVFVEAEELLDHSKACSNAPASTSPPAPVASVSTGFVICEECGDGLCSINALDAHRTKHHGPPSPPALEPCPNEPPKVTLDDVPPNPIAAFNYGWNRARHDIARAARGAKA